MARASSGLPLFGARRAGGVVRGVGLSTSRRAHLPYSEGVEPDSPSPPRLHSRERVRVSELCTLQEDYAPVCLFPPPSWALP